MKPGYGFYRFCYRIAYFIIRIFYRFDIRGRENIPSGAAMVCANHSSQIDPFFVAFAFGIAYQMHIIAKAELFRIPVLSAILKKIGMISVDRGISDVSTVKKSLGYLKDGEKVVIFPEGTRVFEDDAGSAKIGAVKLAERAGAPIVPVFLPRKKPLFHKIPVVIGEPYIIEKHQKKRAAEDYAELIDDLMDRIKRLSPEPVTVK